MFESIGEIQRLSHNIRQLEKEHKSLGDTYYRSMGDAHKLSRQLGKSIQGVISRAKKQLDFCSTLEKEVHSQTFIPSHFPVEKIVYDTHHLPDWFTFVFEKQFDKQKSGFSALAKKTYLQHNLHEKKAQLEHEIDSFSNLNQRYQGLNKTERGCINIDLEGQTFQNKVSVLVAKFVNFIDLMGKKIKYFVDQNVQRSLNYSSNLKGFTQNPNNFILRQSPKPSAEKIYERQPLWGPKPIERDSFKSIQPMPSQVNRGRLANQHLDHRQLTRASSSNRCLHHMHRHDHYPKRPIVTAFDETSSRFNYRDHAPKWMASTLSSFYH